MSATKRPGSVSGLRRGVGAVQADPGPAVSPSPAPVRSGPPPRPEKPVRFTLDLDQTHHTFLKSFAVECGPGIGGAQVLRALLDELQADPELAARVRSRVLPRAARLSDPGLKNRMRRPRKHRPGIF